MVETKWVN
jgi:hypothetical protein